MSSAGDSQQIPSGEPMYRCVAIPLVLALAFLGLIAFIAIQKLWVRPTPAVPVEPYPEASVEEIEQVKVLIVLDGAWNIRRDHGFEGSLGISYVLSQEYPATRAIEQISAKLKSLGWQPLQEDWLNPGSPSSLVTGWGKHLDHQTNQLLQVHQWSAQWENEAGDIVDYTFLYVYPTDGHSYGNEPGSDVERLSVNGSVDSNAGQAHTG